MSRALIVRPEAESELTEAFDWYEGHVPGLGSQFLLTIDAVFSAIQRNPQHYRRVYKVVRRALVRRFPYEVFFIENSEHIIILSVFHAKRNPVIWQDRA